MKNSQNIHHQSPSARSEFNQRYCFVILSRVSQIHQFCFIQKIQTPNANYLMNFRNYVKYTILDLFFYLAKHLRNLWRCYKVPFRVENISFHIISMIRIQKGFFHIGWKWHRSSFLWLILLNNCKYCFSIQVSLSLGALLKEAQNFSTLSDRDLTLWEFCYGLQKKKISLISFLTGF